MDRSKCATNHTKVDIEKNKQTVHAHSKQPWRCRGSTQDSRPPAHRRPLSPAHARRSAPLPCRRSTSPQATATRTTTAAAAVLCVCMHSVKHTTNCSCLLPSRVGRSNGACTLWLHLPLQRLPVASLSPPPPPPSSSVTDGPSYPPHPPMCGTCTP